MDERSERAVNRIQYVTTKEFTTLIESATGYQDKKKFKVNPIKVRNVNKFDFRDVEIMYLESTNIKNYDDKIYITNYIYGLKETLSYALEVPEDLYQKYFKVRIEKVKLANDQLDDVMERVRKSKIYDNPIGLFIKYPEGYTD